MRYNSMFETAFALDTGDQSARAAQWRQLVDLIVQAGEQVSISVRDEALARIGDLRPLIPFEERRRAAVQLAGRVNRAAAVQVFALDEPAIAAPVLVRAELDGDAWAALIPRLPSASRALLRNRRDLPAEAERALASYGLSDFSLPASMDAFEAEGAQIRNLVARIEAFRQSNPAVGGTAAVTDSAQEFDFETSRSGEIDWIVGAPREALIGLSISEIADAGGHGVDGQAAGAFRRRAPFRDARLSVAGAGQAAGDWLISASPVFNPRDGRFAGYHGSARRPRADEMAAPAARFGPVPAVVDSLRQLTHELRTPLNAIMGFAEMIEMQLLGPVALAYRAQAQAVLTDGRRLIEMLDDIEQVAGPDREPVLAGDGVVDAVALLNRAEVAMQPVLILRGVRLDIDADVSVQVSGMSPVQFERIVSRLVSAAVGMAAPAETVLVTLGHSRFGVAQLSVSRPLSLADLSDADLLDPASEIAVPGADAPLLGLGFTLRLLDNLAREVGGQFVIAPDAFVLTLPGKAVHADLPAGTP